MKRITLFLLIICFSLMIFSCKNSMINKDGIYASFNTSMGKFIVKLFYEESPLTVANFIGLTEGKIEFTDMKSGDKFKKSFYDGLLFHRLLKDKNTQECMIIQGGCPLGNGSGNPGYTFADETVNNLKFDSAGLLAMANSGPNTNGSQFFFTLGVIPSLDGRYTIFGNVVSGYDTIEKIGKVKVDENGKPFKEVYIKNIKITRTGEKAKQFNEMEIFAKKDEILIKNQKEAEQRSKDFIKSLGVIEGKIITTKSGLKYFIKKYGAGKIPAAGNIITANYTGYLEDGRIFDSSTGKFPIEVEIGVGKLIKGWDEAFLTMREGEKRVLIIPYYLGYGENGMPPTIPPSATLIFDVELISVRK